MLIGTFVAALSFSSCSKDDKEDDDQNYALWNGVRYELTDSKVWDCEAYMPDVTLTLFNFSLYEKPGGESGFGINLYNLYCTRNSSNPATLADGTYTYSDTEGHLTHDGRSQLWNDDEDGKDIESLTITVKGHGNQVYTITWRGTDEHGGATSGRYKGKIDFESKY